MARHIMAVCVVCLLCAHRLHCQDHIDNILGSVAYTSQEQLNARVYPNLQFNPSIETTDRRQQRSASGDDDTPNYSTSPPSRRHKRHAGHDHGHGHAAADSHVPQITQYYLEKLMGQKEAMHTSGFEDFLQELNLREMPSTASEGTCVPASRLVHHVQPHNHHHHHHEEEEEQVQLKNCTLNSNDTNSSIVCAPLHHNHTHTSEESGNFTLSEKDILYLCPVLLHELKAQSGGCINPSVLSDIDSTEQLLETEKERDFLYVWVYAFISVFACGLLGLVGVAIIPFMGSRYYKYIIQYLVALAVGTMTGDALLHLLPHSLAGQDERGMIMKGLGCLGGIIFFYATEHSLTMISEWRKSVEKKETKKPSRAKVMRDPDSSVNNSVAGDKICKQKYSSYPYCYDEITMNNKQSEWMHLPAGVEGASSAAGAGGDGAPNGVGHDHDGSNDMAAAAESLLSTLHSNCVEMNHHNHNHKHNSHQQSQPESQDNNTIVTDLDGNAVYASNNTKDKDNHVTVILREHESSHHGHSHRHGHVHSPPETLSAVAWMIIMGDGLHNFTDGMAIGAAFAENLAGGFSTSLAVFCHELPHELGDFAILIKAGMSVKSAVYYNLLTGVLSFIGMIFGIAFGQSQDVAQWMFAVAAGLFIYIALVDMMPEISASHKSLGQFLLQILGMLSGVGIMLLIALYEGDLMSVFGTSGGGGGGGGSSYQHVH
ncbi:zinc transporter foi [Drosophila bipectinata]|uniref:zinc transporter foi n=1 Tax=Drosophila bipectinata TaxID=42026 RepID=UPI001C8B077E|nr:zinc transporter foi [Drosophila bipectinata]